MVRFITYDALLRKCIGIDNCVQSAIDNIKNMCNEEDICVVNDIKETSISINNKYRLFNRYYILPVQKENNIRVIFK